MHGEKWSRIGNGSVRDDAFSMYAKYFEKLISLTPDTHTYVLRRVTLSESFLSHYTKNEVFH